MLGLVDGWRTKKERKEKVGDYILKDGRRIPSTDECVEGRQEPLEYG